VVTIDDVRAFALTLPRSSEGLVRGRVKLSSQSDLRYHWVHVRLAAIDAEGMRELVEDAWAFVVPKRVAEEYTVARGYR
jgi:hypothetical protein